MPYDPGLAQLMRDTLGDISGLAERKMFGGLCFTLNGHMVCGVHDGGGMARVGKAAEPAACEITGVGPLTFTGRPMGGMVDVSEEAIADDERRGKIVAMAVSYAKSLPPKVAKPKKPR